MRRDRSWLKLAFNLKFEKSCYFMIEASFFCFKVSRIFLRGDVLNRENAGSGGGSSAANRSKNTACDVVGGKGLVEKRPHIATVSVFHSKSDMRDQERDEEGGG